MGSVSASLDVCEYCQCRGEGVGSTSMPQPGRQRLSDSAETLILFGRVERKGLWLRKHTHTSQDTLVCDSDLPTKLGPVYILERS